MISLVASHFSGALCNFAFFLLITISVRNILFVLLALPKSDLVKVLVIALPNYLHLKRRMSPVSDIWINCCSDIASNYNWLAMEELTFQNLVSLTKSVGDPSPALNLLASSIWFFISLVQSFAVCSSFAFNWNSLSLWLILTL